MVHVDTISVYMYITITVIREDPEVHILGMLICVHENSKTIP